MMCAAAPPEVTSHAPGGRLSNRAPPKEVGGRAQSPSPPRPLTAEHSDSNNARGAHP
jgi:hypothetical protein